MKQPSFLAALPLLAAALMPLACLRAAPLTETTAVQSRPDPAAPVIAYLKAGSEPVPAPAAVALPDGWMAVEVPGPFEAYVLNRDLTKGLEVKTGSALYLLPQDGASVLATMAKGDRTEITGLHGKWTQVRLDKDLVGYIPSAPLPASADGQPPVPEPAAAVPETPAGPGKPAPEFSAVGSDASLFPRLLEGRLVSTHNLLPFHKPYDWQLIDEEGNRRAYLDVSKLLQTDQIDRYVNREVEVSGTMTALPNGKDIVLAVQSLSLK